MYAYAYALNKDEIQKCSITKLFCMAVSSSYPREIDHTMTFQNSNLQRSGSIYQHIILILHAQAIELFVSLQTIKHTLNLVMGSKV